MSKPTLAQLLHESALKAEQEQADAKQVARITAAVKARLKHVHASDDDDLVCPSCGYRGNESDFEPDTDDESDGFRTDPVTGESGQDDPDNQGDGAQVPAYDNRRPLSGLSRDQVIASLNRIRC